MDSHSSRIYVTLYLKRPTRTWRGPRLVGSYLVLLQVGFALPSLLPMMRCALTAPFHPYLLYSSHLNFYLRCRSNRNPHVFLHSGCFIFAAPCQKSNCCEYTYIGGIFSVALSVGLHLPGITWHFALWSPDFPLHILFALEFLAATPLNSSFRGTCQKSNCCE